MSTSGVDVSGTRYIAGGGGGGQNSGGGTEGAGGKGGGGKGALAGSVSSVAGTTNTGGGGGGGGNPNAASAGGSGIVIVAYTTSEFTHTGGNSTGTSGSETWVKFTSSGSLVLTASGGGFTPTPMLHMLQQSGGII